MKKEELFFINSVYRNDKKNLMFLFIHFATIQNLSCFRQLKFEIEILGEKVGEK